MTKLGRSCDERLTFFPVVDYCRGGRHWHRFRHMVVVGTVCGIASGIVGAGVTMMGVLALPPMLLANYSREGHRLSTDMQPVLRLTPLLARTYRHILRYGARENVLRAAGTS